MVGCIAIDVEIERIVAGNIITAEVIDRDRAGQIEGRWRSGDSRRHIDCAAPSAVTAVNELGKLAKLCFFPRRFQSEWSGAQIGGTMKTTADFNCSGIAEVGV